MAGARQRQKAKSSGGDVAVEASKGTKGARRGTREAVVAEEATPPKGRLFFRVFEAAADRHSLSPKDALEAMHWIRQIIGFTGGVAFGVAGVRGLSPISVFLMSTFVVPNSFFQGQLRVDEEQVEKVGSLKTEGLASSVALFFLFWILSYTTFMR
jgi:EMC6